MQELLTELVEKNRSFTELGKVATYIPELGRADQSDLGIVLMETNGRIYRAGNYDRKFTLQSVSKALTLMLALMDIGEQAVFAKVGMEPTGDPFNSMVRLETFSKGMPLNPMINAGAIVITSLIKGDTVEEKMERILDLIRKMAKNPEIGICQDVYESEKETGHRNRSMAYFLKDSGILEGDIETILDAYFMQCAIEVDCEDMAKIGCLIANNGIDCETGEEIIPKRVTRIAKTLMLTCGMYDESGEFAVNVGIPAKSGVGGGVLCAVPDRMGIGVFGPALDAKGNSVAGVRVLTDLANELKLSIF